MVLGQCMLEILLGSHAHQEMSVQLLPACPLPNTSAQQAAEQGKRAEQLARALPDHLRGALGYAVPQGPK